MKMLLFALILSTPALAELPDAPEPIVLTRPEPAQKPQGYFHNKINRTLAVTDLSAHFLDALSTYQFEHDPCNCIVEKGKFYGTFSLAPISRSTVGNFGYQMALGVGNVAVSRMLWDRGERRHIRFLRVMSRAVLMYDAGAEVREPINNWRLIATHGKKGF